jgi:paraquat-inducible protein B
MFVVVSVLIGLSAIAMVGARSIPKETVPYTSYFDESVTGLEVGSPAKFRGVTIGSVSRIEVAPDRRHVKVSYDLTVAVLSQLGLANARGENTRMPLAPNLRAQLNATGVTGIKYLQLDFFDAQAAPLETLPFDVGNHHIPSQPSSMKNIEASVVETADHLPEVTTRLIAVLDRVQRITDQFEQQNLPERLGSVLLHADHTLAIVDGKVAQIDARELSQQAQATLASFQGVATRANQVLDRVSAEKGLLSSVQRASDAVGDAAQNADGLIGGELERTLHDVSEAAASIRELADTLERNPDMLIKGRARSIPTERAQR